MLPEINLKKVSRVDVDRVGWWLNDNDISSRWFGHYECGDPVHRGYDPDHMLEASEAEWNRVFNDGHRLIRSIYNEHDEHIGECFVVLDSKGSAELSLLIGKKELWHRGYGTATIFYLLDDTLASFNFNRIWVNISEENTPALGLFEKFGFVIESNRKQCRCNNDNGPGASILSLDMNLYRSRQLRGDVKRPIPVVTITGLSGSRSEEIAAAVAKMLGGRMVDSEITDRLLKRLRCSEGGLELLKNSFRSKWGRLLQAFAVPVSWPGFHEAGNHLPASEMYYTNTLIDESVSKKQYIEAFSGIIKQLSVEGNVVLHGSGINQFVPNRVPSISVFVSASPELRAHTSAKANDVEIPDNTTVDEVTEYLEEKDRSEQALYNNLLETDLMDMSQYDLIINLDRISVKTASQAIVNTILLSEKPVHEDATVRSVNRS